MFTPAMDYNQQLLAYLQVMRQLLDQWMAMVTAGMAFPTAAPAMPPPFGAPGGQFMPPTMPPMPTAPPSTAPAPPTPPAPAGYAEQLFGHLQAWRQYLEQMAAASPASGPIGDGGKPPKPPNGPSAPGDGADGGDSSRSESGGGSGPTLPPKLLNLPPSNLGGSQITADDFGGTSPLAPSGQAGPLYGIAPTGYSVSQISGTGFDPGDFFGPGPNEPQILIPPRSSLVSAAPPPPVIPTQPPRPQTPPGIITPGMLAQPSAGSAFQSTMERLDLTAVREVAPKSLFSTPGAATPHDR